MKSRLLLSLFALLMATTTWADVEINEENFPDENFRNWVLRQKYGQDGVLTDGEIAGIKKLSIYREEIQSLKGIEFFTALTQLRCVYNPMTSLDVSGCTKLQNLRCYGNQLTSLNVSGCHELTVLLCDQNALTEIDLSNNTELQELICETNPLTSLDLSKNIKLTALKCNYTPLTSIDVSHNTALQTLQCYGNRLTSLDVSHNPSLRAITCYRNLITGAGMDSLVNSLPTRDTNSELRVIWKEDEQNSMTPEQVAAAKAKGWTAYYYYSGTIWKEYEGSDDPTGIGGASHLNDKVQMINDKWYNLAGQRLGKMQRGINIVGGKKRLVK